MGANPGTRDALEYLRKVEEKDAPTRLLAKQERIRLGISLGMRNLRKRARLSQRELAAKLGVGQSWISKLENAAFDHKVESLVKYLDGLSAGLSLGIELGGEAFRINTETVRHTAIDSIPEREDDAANIWVEVVSAQTGLAGPEFWRNVAYERVGQDPERVNDEEAQ
jgi:transcriptional regulator with XRE-family HTH domain